MNLTNEGLEFSHRNLGILYTKLGDYKKAEYYLLSSKKLAVKIAQPVERLESVKCLSNLYKAKGDYVKALQFSEEYILLNDSLFNTQAISKLTEMNSLYELRLKKKKSNCLIVKMKSSSSKFSFSNQGLSFNAIF